MPSQKQLDANRRNTLKSTEPRTPDGKNASSANSPKFGIHIANGALFEHAESDADFQHILDEYVQRYRPTEPLQRDCLEELAICRVLSRRLLRIGTGILNNARQQVLAEHVYDGPDGQPVALFDLSNYPSEEQRTIADMLLSMASMKVEGPMAAISRHGARIARRLRRAEAHFDQMFPDRLGNPDPSSDPAPTPADIA